LLFIAMPGHAQGVPTAYRVGVVPQFDARRLNETWTPILSELARRTGLAFELVPSSDIPAFEKKFLNGSLDLVYLNPYHYLLAQRAHGYEPLVRDSEPLQGILVVARGSAIRDVRELHGKTIAFPAPNALGASLLIRGDLARRLKVVVEPKYVKGHGSVYLNVAKELVSAGGGIQETFDLQPSAVRHQLRVLYKTETFASHPLAAHPRLPKTVREKIRTALQAMSREESGAALLAPVPFRALQRATHADYRPLERLHLDEFRVKE
jgi:phosphonate transport system substrate-binding protein